MITRTRVRQLLAFVPVVFVGAGCATHRPPATAPEQAIAEASIREHMGFLASDALNGRGSGTRDERIAATYIASRLRRWGLEPAGDEGGFVQTVSVVRLEATAPPTLVGGGRTFVHGGDMIVQSMSTPDVSGPLVRYEAGSTVPDGAVVILPAAAGAEAFRATAAAALVLVRETEATRARWAALAGRMPSTPGQVEGAATGARRPARVILAMGAHDAFSAMPDGTPVSFHADVEERHSSTWNAVARLTGRDPALASEVILLSAHLDHLGARGTGDDTIYNGADDDASGSVAVMELAESLARGPRLRRTILFAWFGSEEAGGYGARGFLARPPVPLDHISANLEFEMIGRPDAAVPPHTLWLTGYERTTLGPELARLGARIVADPHPEQNFFERSDNIQLARRGVVAQTVSSFGLHKEYHQPTDEVGLVDFAHMTDAIRSMLDPVRHLADSTFTPEWLPGMRPEGPGR